MSRACGALIRATIGSMQGRKERGSAHVIANRRHRQDGLTRRSPSLPCIEVRNQKA
jgi:hypothetical protein